MKRRENPLTASETLDLISKQWATKRDIMDIGYVGDTTAVKILSDITSNFREKGYRLPQGLVPMEEIVKYFNININYLKKVSK